VLQLKIIASDNIIGVATYIKLRESIA